MKKIFKICTLMLFLALPKVHAQLAVFDGALNTLMTVTGIDQAIHFAQMITQQIENVKNTYQQIQLMIESEKRAINNLKGIADVRNFDDFMKWQNRQLYLEREAENRFDNMGIKIGGKTYTMTELDGIPGAIRNTYGEPYWEDFTDEQRAEMYHQLGLSPANYMYVKTWSAREDYYAKKFLSNPEILAEENNRAGEANLNMINKYVRENKDLDTNEILKNTHVSLMQIETVLRTISSAIAEKDDFEYRRRKLGETPPNKSRFSEHWNDEIFEKISEDDWQTVK